MHWLEDWGCHELSSERGPLTAPEKHNHQPITNQIVSQPEQTWIGNISTPKGRMESVDKIAACSEVKAVMPWGMDQWLHPSVVVHCSLMERNRADLM